jgi:hypothetical protein
VGLAALARDYGGRAVSFDHLLDQELLKRLEQDGPIDVAVSDFEYREHLLPQMRYLWNEPFNCEATDYQRLLLFFRGYSFFRELGENEREFWRNFHQEIGYAGTLKKSHRDLLEKALKSDLTIKNLFVQNDKGEREFVITIDAIWGIRSLNARSLEKLFRR